MNVNDFDCNALCDLGASISVMPRKFYDMLGLPPLENCYFDVPLNDVAKKKPLRKINDVLIMVNNNLWVGSSREVNLPVSFATTEDIGGKIEELNETIDNLDLGGQSEDFMICYDDTSDKSTDTWKTELELHEDSQTTLSSCNSKFDNPYQVLAIVGDNSEEFDDNNNPVLNPANINRGANHLAEGDTAESLANRVKV
jgi:hypothetical protein